MLAADASHRDPETPAERDYDYPSYMVLRANTSCWRQWTEPVPGSERRRANSSWAIDGLVGQIRPEPHLDGPPDSRRRRGWGD